MLHYNIHRHEVGIEIVIGRKWHHFRRRTRNGDTMVPYTGVNGKNHLVSVCTMSGYKFGEPNYKPYKTTSKEVTLHKWWDVLLIQ